MLFMLRPSFRLTLLASFLLIAAILGAAAISGWLSLESFARASREGGSAALALTSSVQQLSERTVDLERSARQYLVLEDPLLRERFRAAQHEALAALLRLETALPGIAPLADEWRLQADITAAALGAPVVAIAAAAAPAAFPAAGLATAPLTRLAQINDLLARQVRDDIARHNRDMLDALDRSRDTLAGRILAAVAAAFALAALTGWWLLRPLQRIERAIGDLGDSRFHTPVVVHGPADLRQLGCRLDWLRLRLAELEANRNRVLRHVSHELKTPLTSLREGVALLADGVLGRLNAEQREVTAILDHNARALQERIEQLLHYNATQFDARRLSLHPVALLPLLREVATELQLQAQARGVRLEVTGDAPIVAVDPGKLRIAFSNLVANAIAFSPAGGAVRLVLTARDDDNDVVVDCIDDGPGVAPDEAERIFEPFFQGSRPAERAAKGSGLGLAIVREFVKAHGGKAYLVPSARGAHFRIELSHAA